jgi:CRISPR-associated protein Csd2
MDHRYDFVYLFDVKDGNPNGDPDAGNLPRIDPETGQGLVTDVCLKRKIRNYIGLVKEEKPPFEIYVKEKAVLNLQHERAYKEYKIKQEKGKLPKEEDARKLTAWMCGNFFDIRAFGAVMSTGVNCGQVRGPIQFAFARSVEPVISQEHAITRCAVTTEKEATDQSGDNRTMGRKFTVPYGLYRAHGFINPHLAAQTGFNENGEDLELFWNALGQMFEIDRSASRGEMAPQKLIVFEHESPFGNAPANKLFERVKVERKNDAAAKSSNGSANGDWSPARSFTDYTVTVDESGLPSGIKIHQKI